MSTIPMKSVQQLTQRSHQQQQRGILMTGSFGRMCHQFRLPHRSIRSLRTMQRNNISNINGIKNIHPQRSISTISTVLGSSVMSTFIKSSYLFWGLPVCAVLEPYMNPLPFDVFFGTLIPYHAYIGLQHIFTDYLPGFTFICYIVAGIMFAGIQNYNINGEGLLRSVRRLFTSQPVAVNTGKRALSNSNNTNNTTDTNDTTATQSLQDTYKSDRAVSWISLNSDKTKDAFVDYNTLEWQESPASGVSRKMIERLGGEVARATTIVRFGKNKSFPEHTHSGGEEFMVLDGVWRDEFGVFGTNSYIRNYIGSKHTPTIGSEGCTILVKLRQMSNDIKEPNHISVDASLNDINNDISNDINNSVNNGINSKILYESKYEKVSVERYRANEDFIIKIPESGKEIFVLDGSFDVSEKDQSLGKWSWARYVSNGSQLNAKSGNEGCYIYVKEGHLNSPEIGVPMDQV